MDISNLPEDLEVKIFAYLDNWDGLVLRTTSSRWFGVFLKTSYKKRYLVIRWQRLLWPEKYLKFCHKYFTEVKGVFICAPHRICEFVQWKYPRQFLKPDIDLVFSAFPKIDTLHLTVPQDLTSFGRYSPDFSFYPDSEPLLENCIEHLVRVSGRRLKELSLPISFDGVDPITTRIWSKLAKLTDLKRLIVNGPTSQMGLQAFGAACINLEHLEVYTTFDDVPFPESMVSFQSPKARKTLRSLVLDDAPLSTSSLELLRHWCGLRSLILSGCVEQKSDAPDDDLAELAKTCPNLTNLQLNAYEVDWSYAAVTSLLRSLKHLERFGLAYWPNECDSAFLDIFSDQFGEQLISLELYGSSQVFSKQCLQKFGQRCKNVTRLGFANFDGAQVDALSHYVGDLQHLDIHGFKAEPVMFEKVFYVAHRLHGLDISNCAVGDQGIFVLAHNCKGLKALVLKECNNISNASIDVIVHNLHNLINLRLAHCARLTPGMMKSFCRGTPLKNLLILMLDNKIVRIVVDKMADVLPHHIQLAIGSNSVLLEEFADLL